MAIISHMVSRFPFQAVLNGRQSDITRPIWVGLLKRPDETNPKEICVRRAADVTGLIVMSSRTQDPLPLGTFGLNQANF
jgi:hypothetical protein